MHSRLHGLPRPAEYEETKVHGKVELESKRTEDRNSTKT
jgi:hypothetical protein